MSDGRDDAGDSEIEWPSGTPRYRFRLPAADESAPLDALAAVLDASPRQPATARFELSAGRRADSDRVRSALSDLTIHSGVTVGDHETTGTVPLTGDTFDALADLADETRSLVVLDDEGTAILAWRDERFTFALPESAVEAVESTFPSAARDRLERL